VESRASAFSSSSSSPTSFTVSSFRLGNRPVGRGANLLSLFLDFLPSYLFTALSSFSWVCWIAPNKPKVNQLFGVSHGLAMGILTFDWGQISYNGSPLPVPWWAAANVGITVAFFYWFLVPILYVRLPCFSPFAFLVYLSIGFCSIPTFGTVLTYPWCPHTPLITRGKNTTSQESSTPTPHSTSRLTRPTAPSSFQHHSPLPTGSRSHPLPQLSPTHTFTTANRFGLRPVAHFPNNLIFTPVSCPYIKRSRIGGT